MEILLKEDFYHQQYGILFDAMIELYSEGQPVDLVTLQNKLKEKMFRKRFPVWSLSANLFVQCRHLRISNIIVTS